MIENLVQNTGPVNVAERPAAELSGFTIPSQNDHVAGGCAGMSYDLRLQKTPYENDIQWEQGGIKIITNPESIQFMHGTEINYVDTLKESGFQYKNPNASGSCGCGTSFS